MYETILVPVDGSDPSVAAAEEAIEIARRFDAHLSLVTAIEVPEPPDSEVVTGSDRRSLDEETARAIERLETHAADAGVAHETIVERGIPHDVISAAVADLRADMVAMGTHGQTGVERVLLGSVTERFLRTSTVPVLTAHQRDEVGRFDDVLVPTDGSNCAERAVDHALAIADRCDATLHALSAVDVQAMASGLDMGAGLPDVIETLTDQREDAVAAVRDRAATHGIDCETAVFEGAPVQAISEYVTKHGVDLVTMGTHGHRGLERLLLGSVAERTIRTSEVPVLAVPPESE